MKDFMFFVSVFAVSCSQYLVSIAFLPSRKLRDWNLSWIFSFPLTFKIQTLCVVFFCQGPFVIPKSPSCFAMSHEEFNSCLCPLLGHRNKLPRNSTKLWTQLKTVLLWRCMGLHLAVRIGGASWLWMADDVKSLVLYFL